MTLQNPTDEIDVDIGLAVACPRVMMVDIERRA